MDPTLRAKIITVLTDYLHRAPSEGEIINAQSDTRVMQWVADLP